MKTELLKILRETDDYVSGQELCDRLGVSRTAIWKRIKKLQEEGYVIEAVQNRGYHLIELPDLMKTDEVRSWLSSKWLGKELYYQESVDSTNTWAKKLAEEGAPNDVVVAGKKVCGILTEMSAQVDYVNYVVIGTGINVNLSVLPPELKEIATSFYLEKREVFPRAQIIARVIEVFEENYEIYTKTNDLSQLAETYNQMLINHGRQVKVLDPSGEFAGVSGGIDRSGRLSVKKEDGTVVKVMAGEVSVRGLYGYV